LDRKMSFIFNLLCDQFAKDDLLGEVLAADDDAGLARATGKKQGRDENDENVKGPALSRQRAPRQGRGTLGICVDQHHPARGGERRFSSQPSTKSAVRAINAAGTAPARITELFTIARPRKISSPRPPAPIAAAIVASPTEITTATRTPARITLPASGNSTL